MKGATGRLTMVSLCVMAGVLLHSRSGSGLGAEQEHVTTDSVRVVRLLAMGDVNLGRTLGKMMLRGDTLLPWRHLLDTLKIYDCVFANLESNLSEQHGRTEDPGSNLIFTGPPVGAVSLRRAGITMVSTANNHALDFGSDALRQTISLLDSAGVVHAGTAVDGGNPMRPAIVRVNGLTLGLIACTEFVNGDRSEKWKRNVADADTGLVYPAIRRMKDSVDCVVVSIHGGDEYAEVPTSRMMELCRGAIDAGALIVLGHHPHVPYQMVLYHGGVIAPSLGNLVFKQPARFWTRYGVALALELRKDRSRISLGSIRCLPVQADYQPQFLEHGDAYDRVLRRCAPDSLDRTHD